LLKCDGKDNERAYLNGLGPKMIRMEFNFFSHWLEFHILQAIYFSINNH